jgi:pimeloyl-ACP methyl ester carboxylesterase
MNWAGAKAIRVIANGITFEVFTAGSGSRLALCLHGFPECAYSWRYQFPMLTKLGYRVWAPNLRGYGNTDAPPNISDYALEKLVNDVAELIRAADAQEVVLIAHDWGAALAWTLAIRQPMLIQRLIICNVPHPACFLRELKRPAQLLRSWYIFFFQIPWLPEALLKHRIADMFLRTTRNPATFPPEALTVYQENAQRPGRLTAMINWYRALIRYGRWRQFSKADYPKIEIPTLFIWGDADTALSIHTTDHTDRYVSNLEFRVLPRVSHWVQQEAHEEVNAIIESWLATSCDTN